MRPRRNAATAEAPEEATGGDLGANIAQLTQYEPVAPIRARLTVACAHHERGGPLAAYAGDAAVPAHHDNYPAADRLRSALAMLDPDEILPKEALAALYHLRSLLS
jgi:hypothetical protein